MGLIGRDYDLVSQILKILRIRVKRKKGMFSKRNCGWTKVQQEYEKEGGKLTSGTTKLTAIAPRGRRSKTWGCWRKFLLEFLEFTNKCRRQESKVWAVE